MQSKILLNNHLHFTRQVEAGPLKKKVSYIRKNSSQLFDLKATRYLQKRSFHYQLKNLLWQGVDQLRRILPLQAEKQEILLNDIRSPLPFPSPSLQLDKLQWIYEPYFYLKPDLYSSSLKKLPYEKLISIRKISSKKLLNFPKILFSPLKGTLLFQEDSLFLYLKVNEKSFIPIIREYQKQWADQFTDYDDLFSDLGMHGIVLPHAEIQKFRLSEALQEKERKVYFGIKEIALESYEDHPEYESLLYAEIDSLSLESIQKKYMGRSFPIRVILAAKQRKATPPTPLYLINHAYHLC